MTTRQARRLCSLFDERRKVTRTEIHGALGRNYPVGEIEPVMGDLVGSGVIRLVRERAAAGRSVDFYEMVEDMNDWLESAIQAGTVTAGPCRPRVGRQQSPRAQKTEDPVYFIQAGEAGPIKIGITCDLGVRLSILQIGSPVPLRILATHPGGRAAEMVLHERFGSGRLHGEWFAPSADLLEYIRKSAK